MHDSYLVFEHQTAKTKTSRWHVRSASSGALLGTIKWFGRWRQYALYSKPDVILNKDCLREIASFMEAKTSEHMQRNREQRKVGA